MSLTIVLSVVVFVCFLIALYGAHTRQEPSKTLIYVLYALIALLFPVSYMPGTVTLGVQTVAAALATLMMVIPFTMGGPAKAQ